MEEMLKQTEEDADKEILEMKTSYEIDLKREAESNVKLRLEKKKRQKKHFVMNRGELGILKKKHVGVHKDLEEQKSGLHSMQVHAETQQDHQRRKCSTGIYLEQSVFVLMSDQSII